VYFPSLLESKNNLQAKTVEKSIQFQPIRPKTSNPVFTSHKPTLTKNNLPNNHNKHSLRRQNNRSVRRRYCIIAC